MTAKDYSGQSKALEIELTRVRGILNDHAEAKQRGVTDDQAPHARKALKDLADVVERFKRLDREFWGL